jgi:hypothetical protein
MTTNAAPKVTILSNGTIAIDGNVEKIGEVDAEPIMLQISELLGDNLGAVKIGGIWVIGRESVDTGWTPLSGGDGQKGRRSFTAALSDATNRTVSSRVPLR